MSQFKWKVYYRTNTNGNVQTVEKEFDSQEEMNEYMNDHRDQFSFSDYSLPSLFGGLNTYVNNLMDQRMSSWSNRSSLSYQDDEDREIEEYAKRRDQQRKEREEKKGRFQKQMDKMKQYVDSFDDDDNEDDKRMREKAQKRHDYYKKQYESL